MKLTAVNGVPLSKTQNLYQLLNHKAGKRVRFGFINQDGEVFEEVIKPATVGTVNNLMYERWIASREALVEELSGSFSLCPYPRYE